MSKKLIFCATALSAILSAQGSVLTPDEALARVMSSQLTKSKALHAATLELRHTVTTEGQPAVYIFAADNGSDGYMVLSADDTTAAILGYSDENRFDAANIPPAMQYWLDCLAQEINTLRKAGTNASSIVIAAPRENRLDIAPLCKTKWNQSTPYNNDCPMDGSSRSVTGCVATAMSQVLKYYNWPEAGVNTASYSWTNSAGTSATLSFDFASRPFDWNHMTDTYSSASTSVENAAVANLMYGCGVSVNMKYTSSESGASSYAIPGALYKYFQYDASLHLAERKYYTLTEWDDMIYDNLVNFGPVLYTGSSDFGGHAFVCDGYRTDGYFHFNWGWGGMSDGYYLLTALDPDSQGIGGSAGGYNFDQDILLGLKPKGNTNNVYPVMSNQGGFKISVSSRTITVSSQTGNGGYFNMSCASIKATMGLKLTAADGSVTYFAGGTNTFNTMSGYSQYSVSISPIPVDGTYTVTPAFRDESGEWRDINVSYTDVRSYNITISNGQITSATANIPANLTVVNYTQDTPFYLNTAYKLSVNLKNSNGFEYSGGVCIYIGTVSNNQFKPIARGEYAPVNISANSSGEMTYISKLYNTSSSSLTAGSYYMAFVDYEGSILDGNVYPVTINGAATGSVSTTNLTFVNSSEVDPMNVEATATMTCQGTYFAKSLNLYIFPYSSGSVSSVGYIPTEYLFMNGNTTQPLTIKGTFADATAGSTYFAALHDGNSWVSNQALFTVKKVLNAVESLTASEAEVIDVKYYSMAGALVSNPSAGLYIKVETLSDGTTRTIRTAVR